MIAPRYRHRLPQLKESAPFLADGGLETTLVFLEKVELPFFAAFPLVMNDEGRNRLRNYFKPYLELSRSAGTGLILDTPTWRANPDWGAKLDFSAERLAEVNRRSIELLAALRKEYETPSTPIVLNGVLGPRGDGYRVEAEMSADDARRYHLDQVRTFAASEADMVSAITMNYPNEAIGIARAAKECGMPAVISFTVETDGKLPTGDTLAHALERVERETGESPAYYMVNCAHPTHFSGVLDQLGPLSARVRGIRANASTLSHAELDQATELDSGDPAELARQYQELKSRLSALNVFGGCCGTDHRHITAIARSCAGRKS